MAWNMMIGLCLSEAIFMALCVVGANYLHRCRGLMQNAT